MDRIGQRSETKRKLGNKLQSPMTGKEPGELDPFAGK
jgi:hypothetical protein